MQTQSQYANIWICLGHLCSKMLLGIKFALKIEEKKVFKIICFEP